MFAKLWSDESGVTKIEYALIVLLVVVVGIGAWQVLGGATAVSPEAASDQWPDG